MRIELGNGYVITSDQFNFVLNKENVVQKGQNAGQTTLEAIAFHPTLAGIGQSLANRLMKTSTVTTLEELSELIDATGKLFEQAVLIQDGKETPYGQAVGC